MPRPFTEFLHSTDLGWTVWDANTALETKLLADGSGIESTRLVRVPPLWQGEWPSIAASEELFVLAGGLDFDGRPAPLHHYRYRPSAHAAVAASSSSGAVMLVFHDPVLGDVIDPPLAIDTIVVPWDRTNLEGEIAHLNYARKNLRRAPNGRRRTYLLGGMPHGFPAAGARLERHPHDEEMFLIAGDMPCSLGVMVAGAYFYRPKGIWHGLDCTLNGFLMLMRTPGANETVSEWSEQMLPVRCDPQHRPHLPAGHAAVGAPPRRLVPDY